MSIYDELAEEAAYVFNEFTTGTVIYTAPDTAGSTPFDTATAGTAYTVNGAIVTTLSDVKVSDRLVAATAKVMFPNIDPTTDTAITFTPVEQGTVTIDSTEREIVAIDRKMGAGTPIMWIIYVEG